MVLKHLAKNEIDRASFQLPTRKVFVMYQAFNNAGVITFVASNFKGHVLEEEIVTPEDSFLQWVHRHIGVTLKELS